MRPIRILLVDDNPGFLGALHSYLTVKSWIQVVAMARSGSEAMALIEVHHPDLVLLDLDMPVMNGLEATRRIKALASPPRVLILTLHDEPELRSEARAAGADEYHCKSDVANLLPRIEAMFPH